MSEKYEVTPIEVKEGEKLPPVKAGFVRIKALKEISVGGSIHAIGALLDVKESDAKEFCKPIKTLFNHGGFRGEANTSRHSIVRAELVKN